MVLDFPKHGIEICGFDTPRVLPPVLMTRPVREPVKQTPRFLGTTRMGRERRSRAQRSQFARRAESPPHGQVGCLPGKRVGLPPALLDLTVELGLMIVVVAERGVDLTEREVRMLAVQFLGAPTISDMIEGNLQDFDLGVVNPGAALFIEPDVRRGCCRWHGRTVAGIAGAGNRHRLSQLRGHVGCPQPLPSCWGRLPPTCPKARTLVRRRTLGPNRIRGWRNGTPGSYQTDADYRKLLVAFSV